jgi:hypothetical protein
MIKLIDLIKGTARDPFTGELYEGLIKTVEPEKAKELLKKNNPDIIDYIYSSTDGYLIISCVLEYPDEKTSNYTTGNILNQNLSNLIKNINNLGYYISNYGPRTTVENRYNPSVFRDFINNHQPEEVYLRIQPKYGEEVTIEVPEILYHVTDSRYISNIKKIVLTPKTKSKLAYHPERVYLARTKSAAVIIADRMEELNGNYKPIILKIDRNKLPKQTIFFNDTDFNKKGVYILGNIPPSAIINLNEI